MHVKNYKDTMITLSDLARLGQLSPEEVEQDIEETKEQGLIRTYALKKDTYVWHAGAAKEAEETLLNALKKYEASYPYRYGMKKGGDTYKLFPQDQA